MMNNELRPYNEYINTDVFWLDRIPKNWRWHFLSQACKEKCYKNSFNTEKNVLSLSYGQIIRKKNIDFGLVPKEYTSYQIVKKGDIILRLTDLQNDKRSLRTGLVKETGIITSAYTCINTKINSPDYIHYILHAYDLQKVFYGMGGGVRQSIGYEDIRKLKLPIPPRTEQDQIVKYLDHQLAKINKFIKAKKKLLAVLKEQKQAIINEAVTKGLKPNVKMKPSGVDWLGDAPENWKILKLKYLTKESFQYGANESRFQYENNAYRYIRITDIRQNGDLKTEGALFLPEAIGANYRLRDGDILFARSGATVGKSFLFKDVYGPSSYAGYLIKFAPDRSKVFPEYVYYYTMSSVYSLWLNQVFIQSTIQNVSAEKYKNLVIPLPSLDEQAKLLIYIKEKVEVFDKSILRILSEIELIQEYKNSLISDVVTGKVDVRNIVIEELEEEIIEDIELDEESIDGEIIEAEDGDE